jgi:hypothetical protein
VYELMSNGSLDTHVYNPVVLLTWSLSLSQVQDRAGAGICAVVPSPGVKPSNIMLDASFGAKLGDFSGSRGSSTTAGASHTPPTSRAPWDTWTHGASSPAARVRSPTCTASAYVVLLEIAAVRPPARGAQRPSRPQPAAVH